MKLICEAGTNVGNKRKNNEDNFLINGVFRQDVDVNDMYAGDTESHDHYVFAVFDGVGGAESGEIASLRAAEAAAGIAPGEAFADITKLAFEANTAVCNEMTKLNTIHMGSTIVALCSDGKKASMCNVGDSVCYLFRDDALTKLSKDHNRAQQMIEFGIITEEEARLIPERHVLTQHLGIFPDEFIISPFVRNDMDIEDGDVFMLCSDGVTDMLDDDAISAIIRRNIDGEPHDMVEEIIEESLKMGGRDNITAIIVKGE